MKSDSVPTVHIGVDVSKAKLDIFVPATKEGVRPATEQGCQAEKQNGDLLHRVSPSVAFIMP